MSAFSFEQAASPATPPELLAQMAFERPDLRVLIASNPSAYPELLTWLSAFEDPVVNAAIAARGQVSAPSQHHMPPAQEQYAPPEQQAMAQFAQHVPQPAPHYAQQPEPAAHVAPQYEVPGQEYPLSGQGRGPGKSRKGLIIGSVVAGALLIGGGAIAANQLLFSKIGGEATPEAAATKLINGIADKDLLSIYGSLSPAEIGAVKSQVEDLTEGVLSEAGPSVNPGELLDLVTVAVTDLEVKVETIEEGLAKVYVVRGSVEVDADPAALAQKSTDLVSNLLKSPAVTSIQSLQGAGNEGDFDAAQTREELESSFKEILPARFSASDLRYQDRQPFLMAVEEDGAWFISPVLTVAEYELMGSYDQRRGRLPTKTASFESPEDAASGLTKAAMEFARYGDFEQLIRVLPLAERRLLSLYIAPNVEFYGVGSDLDMVTIASDDFKTREQKGKNAKVDFENVVVRVDNYGENYELTLRPGCVDVNIMDLPNGAYCFKDIPLVKEAGLDKLALIAVKEESGWFISPSRTVVAASSHAGMTGLQLLRDGKFKDATWFTQQGEALLAWAEADPLIAAAEERQMGSPLWDLRNMLGVEQQDTYDAYPSEEPLDEATYDDPDQWDNISYAGLQTELLEFRNNVHWYALNHPSDDSPHFISIQGGQGHYQLESRKGEAESRTGDSRVYFGTAGVDVDADYCLWADAFVDGVATSVSVDRYGDVFGNNDCMQQ